MPLVIMTSRTWSDGRSTNINRSDAKVGLRAEDVVAAIKTEIAEQVPSSPAVPASVNRGVPLVLDEPRHPVSLAIRQLADQQIRTLAKSGDGTDEKVERRENRKADRKILSWGGKK